jgi:hypothetical protein
VIVIMASRKSGIGNYGPEKRNRPVVIPGPLPASSATEPGIHFDLPSKQVDPGFRLDDGKGKRAAQKKAPSALASSTGRERSMRGGSSFHVAHSAGVAAGHLLPWFYVNKVSAAPAPRQRQQYRN